MATDTIASRASRRPKIAVRKITRQDLSDSLRQGWADFMAMRGDLIFLGLLYPLIGVAAAVFTLNGPLLPFFFPIVAGVGLLGPVAAVGFYELARRREEGLTSNWSHFLDVRKRPAFDDIGIVAGLLVVIFGLWVLAAGILYLALWGWTSPGSIPDFLTAVFTTPKGWALIGIGAVIGAGFAWLVLALSVASLPMLVDCDVSAADAVSASWRAADANRPQMVRWGLTVLALLAAGSIPLFLGLAIVLPWLGYSTWHLYTRLIDRDAIPARNRRRDK
jgi:uncharacterized membrane protein